MGNIGNIKHTRRGAAYRPHGFLQYNIDARCKILSFPLKKIILVMDEPKWDFKGQIRVKRHLDVQNEVSHDRNRLEPFRTVWNRLEPVPEPVRFWSCDTSFCTFKRRFTQICH